MATIFHLTAAKWGST